MPEGTDPEALACPVCDDAMTEEPHSAGRPTAFDSGDGGDHLYRLAEAEGPGGGETQAADPRGADIDRHEVVCPVCGQANETDSLICTRCRAGLRRKHWPREEAGGVRATTVRGRLGRRRLGTLLVVLAAVAAVASILWMTVSVFAALERPTVAYRRMAGMAVHGEWGRYYDRLHPRTRAGLTAKMKQAVDLPRLETLSEKDAFISIMKEHPDLLPFWPYGRLEIVGEKVADQEARVVVAVPERGETEVLLEMHEGVWKLIVPEDADVAPQGDRRDTHAPATRGHVEAGE